MKAICFNENNPELFEIQELSDPKIDSEDLLIEVHYAGVNRADLLQKAGKYPPPPGESEIPGLEVSGIVLEIGTNVKDFKTGDRVMALLAGGGYANRVKINYKLAIHIPDDMDLANAAAIPEAFITAWQGLSWLGKMNPNKKILVHAGASGVGSAAIQIAKTFGGVVFITASKEKHNFCKSLGADFCIDYKTESFPQKIKEISPQGVDLILDFIGSGYWNNNIQVLKQDGILIMLGLLGGTTIKESNLGQILFKRLSIIGSTLRNRPLHYKQELAKDFKQQVMPLFVNKHISPCIDQVFLWHEVNLAHSRMQQNLSSGKIILQVSDRN